MMDATHQTFEGADEINEDDDLHQALIYYEEGLLENRYNNDGDDRELGCHLHRSGETAFLGYDAQPSPKVSTHSPLSDRRGGGGGANNNSMGNDTMGETMETLLAPPEQLEHESSFQRGAHQRREQHRQPEVIFGNNLPLFPGDSMGRREYGWGIQGGESFDEGNISNSDAKDLAHACSEPANFFDLSGLDNFNGVNNFNSGDGGNHHPTSSPDIPHISVGGDDGGEGKNNVNCRLRRRRSTIEGSMIFFDSNANKSRPANDLQQYGIKNGVQAQLRRKTFDGISFHPMEQLESTFDANHTAEMPPVQNDQASIRNNRDTLVPLRKWIECEFTRKISPWQTAGHGEDENKWMFLHKTTVAFGIGELMRKSSALHCLAYPVKSVPLDEQYNPDNFVVRTNDVPKVGGNSQPTWTDITGVDMLSPKLSVNMVEPFFTTFINNNEDNMCRYLEAEFPSFSHADTAAVAVDQSEVDHCCHLFGTILCELFSNSMPGNKFHTNEGWPESVLTNDDAPQEPSRKKNQLIDPRALNDTGSPSSSVYVALMNEGIPSCLCLVIQNLLECGKNNRSDNAYDSLDAAIKDLHLLLLDPNRFLFDKEPMIDHNGILKLSYREHRLYGREKEESMILEAFCRVSSGKSESCFIGGFSGSGKSMLVNDLMTKVDMVGGYVLTHKFDQKEMPMLEVVALFNDLCLLILEKNSKHDILVIIKDLVRVFGSDLAVLARMLPNIKLLSPQLKPTDDEQGGNQMTLQSISFTLQRFIRVVSSKTNPVVLFLDDLQWCDKSALAVVESLLCDAIGSTCVFFIGAYRSNEVADDHEIFCLARRLRAFGVPTTMLSLEGLNPNDLNTMISDAMCMFPRISKNLSDIVYQKTKGNPFFVIAFLKSLVDRGLLEYSIKKRMWVWDKDDVSSMDVTGNILYLLSSEMSGLSVDIQLALKLAACFGIKMKESVVATLGTDTKHSDIRDKLEQVVKEGFMVKVGTSDFKFVHDKVREAAYSLIPKEEKSQYHYSLGMSLYSMTKGQDVDDVLFSIVDQIKLGIGSLEDESPELRIEIAKLNELAGTKAVICSDYVTSRSYFTRALSLLPTDHWKSHYDISLEYSLRLAKSHYSCGDSDKAECILRDMIGQCQSFEDKLPACELLARIVVNQKRVMEAYTLCHQVLSELGEEIPQSLQPVQKYKLIQETSVMLKSICDKDLLEMKEMDERLVITMIFYQLISSIATAILHQMQPFLACRMVQFTMKNGLCKYSITGFVYYANALCVGKSDIEDASRIGKAAMSCWRKRYYSYSAELLPRLYGFYYGFVAFNTESMQSCADMLRQGFDVGMSIGETGIAFVNACRHIFTAFVAGERLPTLLERVGYYMDLTGIHRIEFAKVFFPPIRDLISTLIDNGESTSSKCHSRIASDSFLAETMQKAILTAASQFPTLLFQRGAIAAAYFQSCRIFQAFWQGHNERCRYCIGKLQANLLTFDLISTLITFIDGLNTFRLLNKKSNAKLRSIPRNVIDSIDVLKTAASHSSWNFRNKVQLLEAEKFSYQNHHKKAKASYAAAISSARSSGFIHEQGLACELAGYHFKKIGDYRSACSSFEQAKQCYTEWGSQTKVESVTRQLDFVRAIIHDGGDDTPSASDDSYVGKLFDVVNSCSTIDLN